MGNPLPSRPLCSRTLAKTSTSSLSSTHYNNCLSLGRFNSKSTQRATGARLFVSAFLQNPSAESNTNKSRESIINRLSELRIPSEEEDRASHKEPSPHGDVDPTEDASPSHDGVVGLPCVRPLATRPNASDGVDGKGMFGPELAGDATDAAITARSLRYLVSDPKPEIKLIHRFRPQQTSPDDDFWRSFMHKCRLAWGVFFPPAPRRPRPTGLVRWAGLVGQVLTASASSILPLPGGGGKELGVDVLSAKQVVLSRLQMVLVADRCGVSAGQLLEMKTQTLTALAEYMGNELTDDISQLEVQVSALKPSGERITMRIGFADMLGEEELRGPLEYDYEGEDDDDYFMPEEDDGRVAEIVEVQLRGTEAGHQGTQLSSKSEPSFRVAPLAGQKHS